MVGARREKHHSRRRRRRRHPFRRVRFARVGVVVDDAGVPARRGRGNVGRFGERETVLADVEGGVWRRRTPRNDIREKEGDRRNTAGKKRHRRRMGLFGNDKGSSLASRHCLLGVCGHRPERWDWDLLHVSGERFVERRRRRRRRNIRNIQRYSIIHARTESAREDCPRACEKQRNEDKC